MFYETDEYQKMTSVQRAAHCEFCGKEVRFGHKGEHFRKHSEIRFRTEKSQRKGGGGTAYFCGYCGAGVGGFMALCQHYQLRHLELEPAASLALPVASLAHAGAVSGSSPPEIPVLAGFFDNLSMMTKELKQLREENGKLKVDAESLLQEQIALEKKYKELLASMAKYAATISELQGLMARRD